MTRRIEESTRKCWDLYLRYSQRKHKGVTSRIATLAIRVRQSNPTLNGRRAYNGRALMDFYWLIFDKPELLISSFEHFSFCLAEALHDDELFLDASMTLRSDKLRLTDLFGSVERDDKVGCMWTTVNEALLTTVTTDCFEIIRTVIH
ncbi:hypothetical protein Tco_1525019 [Tanacetum coccineum]